MHGNRTHDSLRSIYADGRVLRPKVRGTGRRRNVGSADPTYGPDLRTRPTDPTYGPDLRLEYADGRVLAAEGACHPLLPFFRNHRGEAEFPTAGNRMTKRSVITLHGPDRHTMEMYFSGLDGAEFKAMEIEYTR